MLARAAGQPASPRCPLRRPLPGHHGRGQPRTWSEDPDPQPPHPHPHLHTRIQGAKKKFLKNLGNLGFRNSQC